MGLGWLPKQQLKLSKCWHKSQEQKENEMTFGMITFGKMDNFFRNPTEACSDSYAIQ